MAGNRYEFLTRWRVEASPEEVYRLLEDPPGYVRWWPAIWLRVEELDPGDEHRVGSVYRITSKGWLPYILRWTSTTAEKVFPHRIVTRADGDLQGAGTWTIRPDGRFTDAELRWEVAADKPLLKYLSFALKPAFAANHNWAMRRGEESLRLELARRHAATDAERAGVPPPPGPTFLGEKRRRKLGLA